MRKRWNVSEDFAYSALVVWLFGGLVVMLVAQVVFAGCSHGHCGMGNDHAASMAWAGGVWYGVVLVPAIIIGALRCAAYLWRERPRRVAEPVVTDLREAPHA